jgi:hypothetical protein
MQERAGMIPRPLEMMSASPSLFEVASRTMAYYMAHPTLGFLLLAHIRLVVAFNHQYPYCIDLNSGLLKHFQGLTEDEVAAVRVDPGKARLEEKDRAMLVFVHKAVTAPEEVEAADVDRLHGLGWNDPDIYDAVAYGANMVSSGILFHAFRMAEA